MSDSHHKESFWRKYIFSTDHKIIGLQYGITALIFLFIGFSLMMVMRWQLAYPDTAVQVNAYYEELKKPSNVAPNGDNLEETIKEGAASGG